MVGQPLDMNNDSFRHRENNEILLGPKELYLSVISALMYLANCTIQILFFCQFISYVQFNSNSKTL